MYCSTDPYTVELLNKYAAQDSRIKLLKSPENRGQAFCRNMGIDACRGKYFTLIDNDDSFALNFVERTHGAIEAYKTDMVLVNILNYSDDDLPKNIAKNIIPKQDYFYLQNPCCLYFKDIITSGMMFSFPIPVYGKFFNTQTYRESGLRFDDSPQMRSLDDGPWFLQLQLKLRSMYFLPFAGVFRRVRMSSDSFSQGFFLRSVNYLETCYHIICDHGLKQQYLQFFLDNFVKYRMYSGIRVFTTLEERKDYLDQCLALLCRLERDKYKRYQDKYDKDIGETWRNIYNALFYDQDHRNVTWINLPFLYDEHNRNMLDIRHTVEGIVDIGHIVHLVTSSCNHQEQECALRDYLNQSKQSNVQGNNNILALDNIVDNGFNVHLMRFASFDVDCLTQIESIALEKIIVDTFTPNKSQDVVMVTGSDASSLKVFYILRQAGYKLVYVVSGHESGFLKDAVKRARCNFAEQAGAFPQTTQEVLGLFDQFVTYSQRHVEQWQAHFQQPIKNLGFIARPTHVKELSDNARYVGVTSTSLKSGFAIFLQVAICMQQLNPDIKFMVIWDKQCSAQEYLQKFHFADGQSILGTYIAQCEV